MTAEDSLDALWTAQAVGLGGTPRQLGPRTAVICQEASTDGKYRSQHGLVSSVSANKLPKKLGDAGASTLRCCCCSRAFAGVSFSEKLSSPPRESSRGSGGDSGDRNRNKEKDLPRGSGFEFCRKQLGIVGSSRTQQEQQTW